MRYSIVIKFAVQWQETKNAEDITSFKTRSMPCRQSWSQIAFMCLAVLAENGDVYQSAAWLNGEKKPYVIRDFVHWYLKTTYRFSQSSLKSSYRGDFPTSKKPGGKLPPFFFWPQKTPIFRRSQVDHPNFWNQVYKLQTERDIYEWYGLSPLDSSDVAKKWGGNFGR